MTTVALEGTGARIVFADSHISADLISLTIDERAREIIETTHLGTPKAKTYTPAKDLTRGKVVAVFDHVPESAILTGRPPQMVRIEYPATNGETATFSFPAAATRQGKEEMRFDQRMVTEVELAVMELDTYPAIVPSSTPSRYIVFSTNTKPFSVYDIVAKTISQPVVQPPTGNGSIVVKYGSDIYAVSSTGRYVSKSTDSGASWGSATDFGSDSIPPGTIPEAIIAKKNGVDHIFIGSAPYALANSCAWVTLGGTQTRTLESNPGGGNPTKSHPIARADGIPLLAQDGVGGTMGRIARYNGSGWDVSTVESLGSNSSAVFCIQTAAGTYIAADYNTGLQGWIRRSTDFASWSAQIDSVAGQSYPTALMQLPTGRVLCIRGLPSNAVGFRYSDTDGASWSVGTTFSGGTHGQGTLPLYDPAAGKLYSILAGGSGYMASSSDGATWAIETTNALFGGGWQTMRARFFL